MGQLQGKWIQDGAVTPSKVDTSSAFIFDSIRIISDATVNKNFLVDGTASIVGDLYVDGTSHMGAMQLDALIVGGGALGPGDVLSVGGGDGFHVDDQGNIYTGSIDSERDYANRIGATSPFAEIHGGSIFSDSLDTSYLTCTSDAGVDGTATVTQIDCQVLNVSGDTAISGNLSVGGDPAGNGPPTISAQTVDAWAVNFRWAPPEMGAEVIDCADFYDDFKAVQASAETDLPNLITAETNARIADDNTLTGLISTEVSNRVSAVSSEAATRSAADANIISSLSATNTFTMVSSPVRVVHGWTEYVNDVLSKDIICTYTVIGKLCIVNIPKYRVTADSFWAGTTFTFIPKSPATAFPFKPAAFSSVTRVPYFSTHQVTNNIIEPGFFLVSETSWVPYYYSAGSSKFMLEQSNDLFGGVGWDSQTLMFLIA